MQEIEIRLHAVKTADPRTLHRLIIDLQSQKYPPKLIERAVPALEKRLDDLGPPSIHNLALLHKRIGNIERMIELYKEAVSWGDIASLYKLGKHYEYSDDRNLALSLEYYSEGARRGHIWAKKKVLHHKYRIKGFPNSIWYWLQICLLAVKITYIILRDKNDSRIIQ